MTTSDFRLISGGRSNLIGKEISLSSSLPNRADCSPEVEFILNEEGEKEREKESTGRAWTYTYRNSICSFVAITEPNCSSRGIQAVRLSPLLGNTTG